MVKGKITKANITHDSERHALPSSYPALANFIPKKLVQNNDLTLSNEINTGFSATHINNNSSRAI